MNEITARDEALKLHSQAQMYASQAQESVLMLGKCMAEMKEKELFKELGYSDFEDYAFKEFNFKKSQANKYISIYNNLGEKYFEEHKALGVSKLYLLSQLDDEDRETIETDAEDSSYRELEKKIKDLEKEKEKMQLSIFDLESENKELKDRPIEVSVQEPDEAEIDKRVKEKTKSLEEQVTLIGNMVDGYKEKENKLIDENRKLKSQLEELQKNTRVDEKPAEAAETSIEIYTRYVNELLIPLNKIVEFVIKLEGEEQKTYKDKFCSVLDKIKCKFS